MGEKSEIKPTKERGHLIKRMLPKHSYFNYRNHHAYRL